MLKDLFDKGKCTLGFHVEAWAYSPAGGCRQTSVCSRCRTESQRVLHEWQEWQLDSTGECQRVRLCRRCQERESTIEHAWGTARYRSEGACEQVRPCSRCTEEAPAETVHVWDSWAYESDGSCTQRVTCSRCAARGSAQRLAHDWNAWQDSQFYEAPVRVCGRCGEMVVDIDGLEDGASPSIQSVARAVAQVTETSTASAMRERVVANQRELLSPVADRYLRFAIEQRAADESSRETYRSLAQLLERCREGGIDAAFAPPAAHAVIGHWRHTEAIGSGGVSLVTDTHLLLDPSGRVEWWSKSQGAMGGRESGRDRGRWSITGDVLHLAFDDGRSRALKYLVNGDAMLCPGDSRYRLWNRIT